jgi:hypothetical protein
MTGAFCWSGAAPGASRWVPLLLLLGACAGHPRAPTPAVGAAWLRADPRRCLLQRDLSEGMEIMAQHCAEAFVRENGYTDLPAAGDSSRWVYEAGEQGPWVQVLATRGGSLARTATTVQCSMRGCVVLFRLQRVTLECAYRAVIMTQVFTHIQVAPGGIRDVRCDAHQT